MSSSKPLTYLSAECVLQYMDPNIRFHLSRHCPTIRSLEQRVPLKITYLKLSEHEFTVNDTRYRLGIFQDYPEDQTIPDSVHEKGGMQVDLDKYGLIRNPTPMDLIPGDLEFNDGKPHPAFYEPDSAVLEASLKKCETELAGRAQPLSPTPGTSQESPKDPTPESPYYSDTSPVYSAGSPAYSLTSPTYTYCDAKSNLSHLDREELEEMIEGLKADILPYQLRRDGLEPTWKLFLQVTISKNDTVIGVQRAVYGPDLAQAMKYLYQKILGGRRAPIQVRQFDICWEHYDMVLRLPANLKLKVEKLKLKGKCAKTCDVLDPIICKSSFPLQEVKANGLPQHSWIRTARTLVLEPCSAGAPPTTEYFLRLENQKMQMRTLFVRFTVADCIPIVQNWLETRKEVGTCYEFEMNLIEHDVLNGMARRFNGSYRDRMAKFPMNNGSELRISYELSRSNYCFTVRMEVVKVGDRK